MTAPIEILFCKTNKTFSKLIMWGLNEPASHLGIDLPSSNDIVHSDLLGLHIADAIEFQDAHVTVDKFQICLDDDKTALVTKKFLAYVRGDGGAYDYGAFMYFAGAAVAHKLTGLPMPATNPWGNSGSYLCTEAAYLLNQALIEFTGHKLFAYDIDLGMVSPWQLRTILIENAGGKNVLDLRTAPVAPTGVQQPQKQS